MKNWIILLAGVFAITVTACKNEDNVELKASFSMKTYEVGEHGLEYGPVKNTFVEQEPIAFDMTLTNEGLKTAHIEYGCGFDVIEIYNEAGDQVYSSKVTTTGCSAVWNVKIVYTGESIGTPTLWDQELYHQDPDTGAISGTGEYLPAGQYTVRAKASYYLDSSENEPSEIVFTDQSLIIEPAE